MSTPNPDDRPEGRVLDPRWEAVLRAGQAAEGEQGTVEPELAVIHLLRHARGPEELKAEVAGDILGEVWDRLRGPPVAWWRRTWVRVAMPVAVAAAALALWLGRSPGIALPPTGGAAGESEPLAQTSPALALEAQFAALAPRARDRIAMSVETHRGSLRASLLGEALAAGRTQGGAP